MLATFCARLHRSKLSFNGNAFFIKLLASINMYCHVWNDLKILCMNSESLREGGWCRNSRIASMRVVPRIHLHLDVIRTSILYPYLRPVKSQLPRCHRAVDDEMLFFVALSSGLRTSAHSPIFLKCSSWLDYEKWCGSFHCPSWMFQSSVELKVPDPSRDPSRITHPTTLSADLVLVLTYNGEPSNI